MSAMSDWCTSHQASPLTTEMFFKNTDGSDACSKMLVEVGNADGVSKDIVELMWVDARNRLVQRSFQPA